MTTYSNDQVISGKEAAELLTKHGAYDMTAINGDILDFEGVTNPFQDDDVVVIHCGVTHVSLRVAAENFQVFLNSTAKMVCGDMWENNWTFNPEPEWKIVA